MARPFFRRRKSCPFSGKDAPQIDYKDVRLLQGFVSERGKIVPSRITAVSHQEAARAGQGDQARPPSRPASLCREIRSESDGRHSARAHREARRHRRRGEGEERLCPQLPPAQRQGAARQRIRTARCSKPIARRSRRPTPSAAARPKPKSKKVDGAKIQLIRQASNAGQLYGSVSARDLAEALEAAGPQGRQEPDRARPADQGDRRPGREGRASPGSLGDDHASTSPARPKRPSCRRRAST